MHFITGKQLPRRTFLRGAMGAAVALPFLDAMVAAKGIGAKAAEATNYKMSSFILGVVKSDAFRMKRVEAEVKSTTTETKAGR